MAETRTNPNGANGVVLDPRQAPFLEYLFDRKGETYLDVVASAVKAGFSESYAIVLKSRMPDWLSKRVKRVGMLAKAEKNLNEVLELETKEKDLVGNEKENPQLLKIKVDVSKFIAETIGKDDYGKNEGGYGNTFNTIIFSDEQSAEIARRRLAGDKPSEAKSS